MYVCVNSAALCFCSPAANTLNPIATPIQPERGRKGSRAFVDNASLGFLLSDSQTWAVLLPGKWIKPGRAKPRGCWKCSNTEGKSRKKTSAEPQWGHEEYVGRLLWEGFSYPVFIFLLLESLPTRPRLAVTPSRPLSLSVSLPLSLSLFAPAERFLG